MCGIAAIFAYSSDAPHVERDELLSIRDHMIPRGPDGVGEWFSPDGRVALGHRRLAIIDLSATGAQPMWNADRTLCIIFNGEIYNYQALRAQLQARGSLFRSNSDTEVLLHLYARKGADMVHDLRGMYAFALWDARRRSLFLARDPFGIKPLYYADDGRTIRIASQVKALLQSKHIDTRPEPAGHVGFFLWGHVPDPFTMYQGIKALPAGHTLTIAEAINPPSAIRNPQSFCSIPEILRSAEQSPLRLDSSPKIGNPPSDFCPLPSGTKGEVSNHARESLRSSLADSISHHLIADVPVGVFQSAGLDSSTITAFVSGMHSKVRTVTLGFNEYRGTENDEVPLAETVARSCHTDHRTIWVSRSDFATSTEALFRAMDQPSIDGVNTYFVSQAARASGLKVALSGLGGDEIFGGYPSFRDVPGIARAVGPFGAVPALGRGFRIVSGQLLKRFTSPKYAGLFEYGSTYGGAYLLRRGLFMPWELPEFLDPDLIREGWRRLNTLAALNATADLLPFSELGNTGDSPVPFGDPPKDSAHLCPLTSDRLRLSALELTWYMRHQLLRDADWAGMAHSLEIRVPLVDLQLLRSLLPALQSDTPPTKRDMALSPQSPLPAALLSRAKTGFSVPVHDWLLESNPRSAFRVPRSGDRGLRGWARHIYSRLGGTSYTSPRSKSRPHSLGGITQPASLNSQCSAPSPSALPELPVTSQKIGNPQSAIGNARGSAPPIGNRKSEIANATSEVSSPSVLPSAFCPLPSGTKGEVSNLPASDSLHSFTPAKIGNPKSEIGNATRAFVLLTDGFGGFGGIAKFNRDFLTALCSHPGIAEVIALPRLAPEPIGALPDKLTQLPDGLGGKRLYFRAAIHAARQLRLRRETIPLQDGASRITQHAARTIIFCAHINLLPFAFMAHCILRAPIILNLHGIEAWTRHRNPFLVSMLRRVSAFISVSEFTRERFLSWSRPGSQPFFILPNCVDLSAFAPGPRNPELVKRHGLGGRKVIMTLARLPGAERYKGIDEVLEVLPQLAVQVPNLTYLICGDGDDRPRLVAKARALGCEVLDLGSTGASPVPLGASPDGSASASDTGLSASQRFSVSENPLPSDRPSLDSAPKIGNPKSEIANASGEVSNPLASDSLHSVAPPKIGNPKSEIGNASAELSNPSVLPSAGPNSQLSTRNSQPTTPSVVFTGRIHESEKADYLRLADVFVMPGSGEGFGIVYLEALACGVPVIGSKLDGSRDALRNGQLGTLVDPRNSAEIISAMLDVLNRHGEPKDHSNVARGVEYFSFDRFQQRLHAVIDAIAGGVTQIPCRCGPGATVSASGRGAGDE